MSDLVGNPEDRFSRVAAQLNHTTSRKFLSLGFRQVQAELTVHLQALTLDLDTKSYVSVLHKQSSLVSAAWLAIC